MSFPAYESYISTGDPFLGEVPEHWHGTKLGFLCFKVGSGKTPKGGAETYIDEGVLFIRSQNVYDDGLRLDDVVYISDEVDMEMAISRVEHGDVLLNITGASLGRTCLVPDNIPAANVNQHVCIIRLKDAEQREFVAMAMKAFLVKSQIDACQNGAAREGLNFEQIGQLRLALPPLDEQKAISSFLDVETSKIDGLVSEQRLLIELLKEKRQAVISHAVTKGLNPNALTKPSGIQWLGDVPQHWEVACLKHYVSTVNGFGFSSSDFQDDGVPFIRAGNIKNKSIRPPTIFLPEEVVANYERVILAARDIVISMVGSDPKIIESAVGQVGIVPEHLAGAVPNQNVVIMRENRDFILSRYLFYTLCGTAYRNHLNVFSHKLANQSIISSSLLVAAKFTFPNKQEQQAIVDALDEFVAASNQLLAEAERAIELLQERRTALISAAVTGKIDVRGYACQGINV